MRISLRIEDVENKDLAFFLFTPSISLLSGRNFEYQPARFLYSKDEIEFDVLLGLHDPFGEMLAFTEISFDTPIECNFSVFDSEIKPKIVSGRAKESGEIASLRYNGEENVSYLLTKADLELELIQETESAQIEKEIRDLLPQVSAVFNHIRDAILLELFDEAIQSDFLIESIRTRQRHLKVDMTETEPSYEDAAYLFAAFRNVGVARLTQVMNIRYEIKDTEGRSYRGLIHNSRSGFSPINFSKSLDSIQERIIENSPIYKRVMLAACEFLYTDDFRMAVFNAATVLELAVKTVYQHRTSEGGREASLVALDLKNYMVETKSDKKTALVRHFIPKYLSVDRDWQTFLDRCLDAWRFRDKTAAHLTTSEHERLLSRVEAWEMVVSIWSVVSDLFSNTDPED